MSMISNKELLRGHYPAYQIRIEVGIRIAEWYAKRKGYKADRGGWIRRPDGSHICQGYYELYKRLKAMKGGLEKELEDFSRRGES